MSCNSYIDEDGSLAGVYDIDVGAHVTRNGGDALTCPRGEVCIQSVSSQPGWGYMSYDNILYAMLNLFTVISTEGWTDLMYQSQDSVSDFGAGIFYCLCIYLMTYIMVPMFIGKPYHFEKKNGGKHTYSNASRHHQLVFARPRLDETECVRHREEDASLADTPDGKFRAEHRRLDV